MPSQKMLIGARAAELITADDSIIIASGTTIHAFARCIKPKHHLTAISACLLATEILGTMDNVDVIQLGGMLRHSSLSVVGELAKAPFAECSCSKLFLGVDGIDPDFGRQAGSCQPASTMKMPPSK